MYETEPTIEPSDVETPEIPSGASPDPAESEPPSAPTDTRAQEPPSDEAPNSLGSAQPDPEPPPSEPIVNQQSSIVNSDVVPLARLQGVQRQLSQVEKDRDGYKALLSTVQEQLDGANRRAAAEYAERIKSTQRDIVPDLIRGETIEQVEQSVRASRAAFAAARAAYARAIPTPAVGNGSASTAAQPDASPVSLISRGLRQTNDINQ